MSASSSASESASARTPDTFPPDFGEKKISVESIKKFIFAQYLHKSTLEAYGLLATAKNIAKFLWQDLSLPPKIVDILNNLPWEQLNAKYTTVDWKEITLKKEFIIKDICEAMWAVFLESSFYNNFCGKFNSIYIKKYAPPKWSSKKIYENLENLLENVKVIYNENDSLPKVKEMATTRDFVNIAMRRSFDRDVCKRTFGHSEGAYKKSVPGNLMPNIAILCKQTKFRVESHFYDVNIIHLVGAAFDTPEQPDCKHFCRNKIDNRPISHLLKPFCQNVNLDELKEFYMEVWGKAFEAVRLDPVLTTLKAVGVGANNFSPFYNEDAFKKYIQDEVIRDLMSKPKYSKVKVQNLNYRIPDGFANETAKNLKETLFINAWDPWSMVGNGNSADYSLDGFVGRSSISTYQCFLSVYCNFDPKNPNKCYIPVKLN